MPAKRIGALTIGQSPRPDLVEPLTKLLPNWEIIQVGALDGLSVDDLSDTQGVDYPLVTRMRDSSLVMVAENFVAPKLQNALDKLEATGVAANLLMCAGTFSNLKGVQPLFKPFNIGQGVLRALGINSIGLVAPVPEQEGPIQQRWDEAGFSTTVWTADIGNQDDAFYHQIEMKVQNFKLESIVLDYFGHPIEVVQKLQKAVDIPVLDLGYLAISTMANTV